MATSGWKGGNAIIKGFGKGKSSAVKPLTKWRGVKGDPTVKRGGSKPSGTKPKPGTTKPPTKPATTAPAPKPPATPYLTPAQQAALNRYDLGNSTAVGAQQRRISDSTFNTNQSLAQNASTRTLDTSNANQSMAARGLFESSIRDGDLNDIDATITMRNNILNTNLGRVITDANSAIGRLNTDYGITHGQYNQLAVENAQAITPDIAPGGTASAPASGTSTGAGAGSRPSSTGGSRQRSTNSWQGGNARIRSFGRRGGVAGRGPGSRPTAPISTKPSTGPSASWGLATYGTGQHG